MHLQVNNTRTTILGADPYILNVLNYELRYPTELAIAQESGIVLPVSTAWDGWVRFLHIPKKSPPWFPTGLIFDVARIANKMGYPVTIEDQRVKPELGVPEAQVKIPLRPYQEEATGALAGTGRGVLDSPPRSGKTRILCEVHRRLALRTLWIAPTDRIVRQTKDVIEEFFGANYVYHLIGSKEVEKAFRHHVVVCTIATAALLPKEAFQKIEMLVCDEFHHSASTSVKTIFDQCGHVFYRYGMTGTFFRSGNDAMAMHALLSRTVYKITSQELLDLGYLISVRAVFIPVLSPKLRGVDSSSFNGGHGKKGIHEHEWRNQLAALATFKLIQDSRKILILVGTKRQGYLIRDILRAYLPEKKSRAQFSLVEFMSTDVHRGLQSKILKAYNESDEIRVLIGTSMLGEGVDLPGTDALVYARGEKAEVTLTQGMYRVGTALTGKRNAILVDFADRHNAKLERHSQERLRIYFNESIFSVDILQDPQEFPRWLQGVSNG